MIDWMKEAGAATHEDFGSDVVRAVAAGMREAYAMGLRDAREAAAVAAACKWRDQGGCAAEARCLRCKAIDAIEGVEALHQGRNQG